MQRGIYVSVDSAGLDVRRQPNEEIWLGRTRKQVTADMVRGADIVFALSYTIQNELSAKYGTRRNNTIDLGVPDCFSRGTEKSRTQIDDDTDPEVAIETCARYPLRYYFGPVIFNQILKERAAPHLDGLKNAAKQLELVF